MKKFLLSSLLGVLLLGFGGITMAITHIDYYTEEGASEPCLTDGYSSATRLLNITDISADTCARPAGKQFAGWKIDGSACEDGWKYYGYEDVRAENNIEFFPAGTTLYCSKSAQHFKAYPQRVDTAYDLWIGRTQVTNENINDILGDGKVSFNPETSTLNLNEATLSDCGTIWVSDDPNFEKIKAATITSKLGTLNVNGNATLEGNNTQYSIYTINDKINNGGNLTINGNLNFNKELHILGNLNITNGSLSSTNGPIWCYDSITFGSNVTRIDTRGIHAQNGITIESPLQITKPTNWNGLPDNGWYHISYSQTIIEPVVSATEITNINISGITNPIIGQQPTVAGLIVTSTPENAIDLDSVLVPAWRASEDGTDNGYRNLIHDQSGISWSRPPFNKTPLFYFIRIIFTPKDGYTLAENYTVTANDGYSSIRTGKSDNLYNPLPGSSLNDPGSQNKYSAGLNYIHIIYNTADIPETTPVTSISITGITLPVGGATPTLEGIESQTDGVSVVQSRPFDGGADVMIWFDVEGGHEQYNSFVAGKVYRLYMPLVIADGYTLANGCTASFGNYNATVDYDTNQLVFEFTATEPTVVPTTYTVTWKNGETILETDENVVEGAIPSYDGATPTKAATSSYTYSFKGWSKDGTNVVDLATETITDNTTYTALFNETAVQQSSSSSSSGGGGGGGTTVTKSDTKTDETKAEETKQDENKSDEKQENNTENPESTQNDSQKVLEDGLTQEFHDAYDFAYKNGITTMPTAKEANMKGPLTRIAMAKMLSNYAINVLGKKPANKVVPKFPDVDEKLNEDYGGAVDLAYQLGIMGINIDEFRPFDPVDRKEFGTALSRMLFGLEDGKDTYYSTHLKKLKEEGIITNDNPNLQEARGYVMIMLMRSAK